jgi:hypothetical protein
LGARPSGTSRKIYTGVSAPRGRPPYDFVHDPERYAIAYIDALVALGVSETDAFKAAAARMVVSEVAYAQTVLLPLLAAKILSARFYARRSD